MTIAFYKKKNLDFRQRNKWQEFSIAAGITSLLFLGNFLGTEAFLNTKAQQWGQNLKHLDRTESHNNNSSDYRNSNPIINTYLINRNESNVQKERIIEQLTEIRNRAQTHLTIALDLYIWSILAVSNATISSVVSGLCLLYITRKGWNNSNPSIMGIFIISIGISTLSSTFVISYRYEENIKINSDFYRVYINLENKILTDLTTEACVSRPKTEVSLVSDCPAKNLGEIISKTNIFLQELPSFSYQINLASLPNPEEIFNNLETTIQR